MYMADGQSISSMLVLCWLLSYAIKMADNCCLQPHMFGWCWTKQVRTIEHLLLHRHRFSIFDQFFSVDKLEQKYLEKQTIKFRMNSVTFFNCIKQNRRQKQISIEVKPKPNTFYLFQYLPYT